MFVFKIGLKDSRVESKTDERKVLNNSEAVLSNIYSKSKVSLKLFVSNFHGGVLRGSSFPVHLANMLSDVCLNCQHCYGSQELLGYSNNEFQQDETENILRNRKVELADDHASGVGGDEDEGEQKIAANVASLLQFHFS